MAAQPNIDSKGASILPQPISLSSTQQTYQKILEKTLLAKHEFLLESISLLQKHLSQMLASNDHYKF